MKIKILLLSIMSIGSIPSVIATDGDLDTSDFNSPNGYNIGAHVPTNDPADSPDNPATAARAAISPAANIYYMVGSSTIPFVVAYDSTAGMNSTFNGGTLLQTFEGYQGAAVAVYQTGVYEGQVVVVGGSGSSDPGFVARLNADGTQDNSFAPFGLVVLPTGFSNPTGVIIQSDNKIVVMGGSGSGGTTVNIARYNTDGSLDVSTSYTITAGSSVTITAGANGGTGSAYVLGGTLQDYPTSGNISFALYTFDYTTLSFVNWTGAQVNDGTSSYNSTLNDLLVYPSDSTYAGSIVAVGSVAVTGPGTNAAAARWNSSLVLDTTFGAFGTGSTYYNSFGTASSAAGVSLSSTDNTLQVAGSGTISSNTGMLAFALDATGTITSSNILLSGAVATDIERITTSLFFVAGSISGSTVGAVMSPTCTLDTAGYNSPNGFVETPFYDVSDAHGNVATDCAVQSTGQIVNVGFYQNSANNATAGLMIRRWNSDGSLDVTFNDNQQAVINTTLSEVGFFSVGLAVVTLALDSSDRINVALGNGPNCCVLRYLADGPVDSTFGTSGIFTFNVGTVMALGASTDGLNGIVIDGSGSLYVLGTTTATTGGTGQYLFIAKITPTGALDSTFNGNGIAILASSASPINAFVASSIALQGTNPVIAGYYTDSISIPIITSYIFARYTTTGALDATFGTAGVALFTVPGGSEHSSSFLNAIGIDPQSRIIAVGARATPSATTQTLIMALTANGTLDSTFGTAGYTINQPPASQWYDLAIGADGTIIVVSPVGAFGSSLVVAKYTPAGVLDTTFGPPNGYTETTISTMVRSYRSSVSSIIPTTVALTADNSIVVAGGMRAGPITNWIQLQYLNSLITPITVDKVFCSGSQQPALVLGHDSCQRVWIEKNGSTVVTTNFRGVITTDQVVYPPVSAAAFDALGALCDCS